MLTSRGRPVGLPDRKSRWLPRHELKYVVRPATARRLIDFVRPHLTPDAHGRDRPDQMYTVRSVYFDSPSLECFRRKVGGQQFREKYRLRTYNAPGSAPLRFELKQKSGADYSKYQIPVDPRAAAGQGPVAPWDWLSTPVRHPGTEAARQRILVKLRCHAFRPVVLVTYEREAYVGRWDDTVRVTLDRQVRAARCTSAAAMHDERHWRHPLADWVIVEVKFTRLVPRWMGAVHARLQLKSQACSKYCTAVAELLGRGAGHRDPHV